MSTTFKNAPLVEIVAELRWNDSGFGPTQSQPPQTGLTFQVGKSSNKFEEFYMAFGADISQHGFSRVERLLPKEFPAIPFQPVYRFRKGDDPSSPILYQVGPGLFSANALPPYKAWHEFSPIVRNGVEALLKTRGEDEKNIPFSTLSLRYIDAFRAPLTMDLDVGAFLADVLGIRIELPSSITKHLKKDAAIKPHLQLSIPMDGCEFRLTLADGAINNEPAIIMDFNVTSMGAINPDADEIIGRFNSARDIIHYTFLALTEKIQDLMQPIKE